MAEPTLAQTQAWLQRALLGGGAAEEFAATVVAGDARLPAAARVAVYARGYRARLVESLRGEYPALRRFAGDTAFDLFAEDYIAAGPPTGTSLYGFGAGFADHLERRRPEAAREPGSPLAIAAQLARLERARSEVQRAEGLEGGAPAVAADAALLPGARLRRPASVRLLRLDFDLAPLVEAADRGEPPAMPPAQATWMAVARVNYRVRLHRLERWQFAWLEAIGSGATEVQEAAAAAARACGGDGGRMLAALALWLPAAGQAGLVAAAGQAPQRASATRAVAT